MLIARRTIVDVDPVERIIEQAADVSVPPMATILAAAARIDAAELLDGVGVRTYTLTTTPRVSSEPHYRSCDSHGLAT